MAWAIAPSVDAAFDQADALWPNRDRFSDGAVGDTRHSRTESDHNPGARDLVHAFDLTHDPSDGPDCNSLAELLRQRVLAGLERRIKYVIFNRRIFNPSVSKEWRDYTGRNTHDKHMHVSILSTPAAEQDCSTWWDITIEEARDMAGVAHAEPVPGTEPIELGGNGKEAVVILFEDGAVHVHRSDYKGGPNVLRDDVKSLGAGPYTANNSKLIVWGEGRYSVVSPGGFLLDFNDGTQAFVNR